MAACGIIGVHSILRIRSEDQVKFKIQVDTRPTAVPEAAERYVVSRNDIR